MSRGRSILLGWATLMCLAPLFSAHALSKMTQSITAQGAESVGFEVHCVNALGMKLEMKGLTPMTRIFQLKRPPVRCEAHHLGPKDALIRIVFDFSFEDMGVAMTHEGNKGSALVLTKKNERQVINFTYENDSQSPVLNDPNRPRPPNRFSGQPDTQALDRMKQRLPDKNGDGFIDPYMGKQTPK